MSTRPEVEPGEAAQAPGGATAGCTESGEVCLIALAYNHAPYLQQLFDSIERNASALGQLVLIDNGSSDGSQELLRHHAARLRPTMEVALIFNPPRTGVGTALNSGLRAASRDFVAVIAMDDYLLPDRFTGQLRAMRADPSLRFCYSNGVVCDESGALTTTPLHDARMVEILKSPGQTIAPRLVYPVPALFTQCALFRRDALLAIGGWDQDLLIEDWPLNLRLFSRFGPHYAYVDAVVTAYRRHASNASRRRFRQYLGQKQVLEARVDGLRQRNGLFALFAAQAMASAKRRQWRRVRVFAGQALHVRPAVSFMFTWLIHEFRRRIASKRIR